MARSLPLCSSWTELLIAAEVLVCIRWRSLASAISTEPAMYLPADVAQNLGNANASSVPWSWRVESPPQLFNKVAMWARNTICAIPHSCDMQIVRRWLLVLDSSRFQHIIGSMSLTCAVYGDDPLAVTSEYRRGMLLEALGRQMLEELYPRHQSQDACSALTCVNGSRRGRRVTEWDFTLGGKRLELKSGKLCFDTAARTRRVSFANVKIARNGYHAKQPFDDLYLMIYTPDGFYLILHDLKTGISRAGVRTRTQGHLIRVRGRAGQACWEEALETILAKFTREGRCEVVCRAGKDDVLVSGLYSKLLHDAQCCYEQAYQGIPLSAMSPSVRALRVQQIAFEVDKMMHPHSAFATASGEQVRLHKRGGQNAAVDWIRDGVRVEVKHGKVRFGQSHSQWRCTFHNIKEEPASQKATVYFDELWLALYSPVGLQIFKHPNYRSSLSSRGVRTPFDGKLIELFGPRHEICVKRSVGHMNAKLEAAGAMHFCTIRWMQ